LIHTNILSFLNTSYLNAYHYAKDKGYKTTSSVFDKQSLDFLLKYDIPFVKIPCKRPGRDVSLLIREIPRKYDVIKSIDNCWNYEETETNLLCVSKYPATIKEYDDLRPSWYEGISDHTIGWELYNKYKPRIYECHYVLEHDENNPDGGAWARTPESLALIL